MGGEFAIGRAPGAGGGAAGLGTWEVGDLRGSVSGEPRRDPTLPRSGRGCDARGRGMTSPMGGPGAAEAAGGKCARWARGRMVASPASKAL